MKKRAMDRALAAKQSQIERAKRDIESNISRAFEIGEIAGAHEAYVNLKFEKLCGGKANDDDIKKAYENYVDTLSKFGFEKSDFEYAPSCKRCNDTGSVGGKVCPCVWDGYIKYLADECKIYSRAPFTFDECNLSVVKDEAQRADLEKLYSFMSKYAGKLPTNTNNKIVTLSGCVGTGKTCLASAVARKVLSDGKSALVLSAYEFTNTMLKCHTSPIAERENIIHDVLTADLLVIDDLGTEPMLKNVTVEYLLLVLNERLNAGLCTIITTNLGEDKIMSRYGERVYSRLSDKAHSKFLRLNGKDLRNKI